MRIPMILVAALALSACTAVEGERMARSEPYTICVGAGGETRAAICRGGSPSRVVEDRGVCTCSGPEFPVLVRPCGAGESPPAQTAAYERALRDLGRDGSLSGDRYEGREICASTRDFG